MFDMRQREKFKQSKVIFMYSESSTRQCISLEKNDS